MPALNRPEMAALALQRIAQTKEANLLDVRIYVDTTTDQRLGEFEYIRDNYFPTATIYHARDHVFAPSGCWNILHALKAGFDSGCELVFLIEEDVMVSPDFFSWSFENALNGCFATCGRLRKEHSSDYYTNPGACFPHQSLGFLVPHICKEYFEDRKGYCDSFGPMDEASDLDDGLIRRVIRSLGSAVLYPETPKVAHQGFHYYNKLVQFKNEGETIAEKIQIASDLLARVSPLDRYSKDFEPLW